MFIFFEDWNMIENQEILQMTIHLHEELNRTSRNKNSKLNTQWENVRVD